MDKEMAEIKRIKKECIETMTKELPEELLNGKVNYIVESGIITESGPNFKKTVEVTILIMPRGVTAEEGRGRVPTFPALKTEEGKFIILLVDGFGIKPEEIDEVNEGIEKLAKNPDWAMFLFDYIVPLQGGDFGLLSISRSFKVPL